MKLEDIINEINNEWKSGKRIFSYEIETTDENYCEQEVKLHLFVTTENFQLYGCYTGTQSGKLIPATHEDPSEFVCDDENCVENVDFCESEIQVKNGKDWTDISTCLTYKGEEIECHIVDQVLIEECPFVVEDVLRWSEMDFDGKIQMSVVKKEQDGENS